MAERKFNLREACGNLENYLAEHFPAFEIVDVRRRIRHPDSDYPYAVVGYNRQDGTYAVWEAFNARDDLRGGRYPLPDLETSRRLVEAAL